ncbi:hypothetical protein BDN72DRAFT_786470 [Pluteus cervinus]|uniref:Uncharacterized protein n=1 Tax=Pluteus cervinus TaxID=181527 RepID=A0ACD3BD57_9AGAR|nr:hypothetical protein BDN72DRAFT_786470 [Pluteus cervinus]
MNSDYFSIEAILAENQKVQCAFKQDLPNLGHLGGGSERHIKASNKLQIPIWLAYTIIFSDWADFMIPAAFNPRVKNALRAEAKSVRLSNLVGSGGSWYGFGKLIMDSLDGEQAEELSQMLESTFRHRLIETIDQAQHFGVIGTSGVGGSAGDTSQIFREGLDTTERELFALAQESARKVKKWYETSDKSRR